MLTLGIGRVQKTNGWEQRTLKKVVANVTSPSYSNTLSTIRIACNDHIYRQQGGILFCLRHNEIFFKSFFLSVLDEVAFIILGIKTKTRINFNKSIFLITQPSASQLSDDSKTLNNDKVWYYFKDPKRSRHVWPNPLRQLVFSSVNLFLASDFNRLTKIRDYELGNKTHLSQRKLTTYFTSVTKTIKTYWTITTGFRQQQKVFFNCYTWYHHRPSN